MRTLGQKRAEYALAKVTSISLEAKEKEKFMKFSAAAPSMILQNGFGQALAFWVSKKKNEHMIMFNIVREWLSYKHEDVQNEFVRETESPREFFEEISKLDQKNYLMAQKESLSMLEWVKRFANSGL